MSKLKKPIRQLIERVVSEGLKELYYSDPEIEDGIIEAAASQLNPELSLLESGGCYKTVLAIEHPRWRFGKSLKIADIKIPKGLRPADYCAMAEDLQKLTDKCRKLSAN